MTPRIQNRPFHFGISVIWCPVPPTVTFRLILEELAANLAVKLAIAGPKRRDYIKHSSFVA